MSNILDLQSESRRQIKKPALMCLKPLIKLRKIAASPSGSLCRSACFGLHVIFSARFCCHLLQSPYAPVNQAPMLLPTKPQHSRAPIPLLGFLVYP